MSEERRIQELGRPGALHTEGMVEHANNKEGCLTVRRESDQLIVLGGRESRLHGEGAEATRSRQRKKYLASARSEASEPSAGTVRLGRLMHNSLPAIAQAAQKDGRRRFRGLYSMLNRWNFEVAYRALRKDAAAGEDGVTYRAYGENLHNNLVDLEQRLKEKRYRAKLVRRVFIPKRNNKLRPLGIPALEDKIVQYVVREILQALFESLFLPCSYAYRPNKSAQKAVEDLRSELMSQCVWVVEADISGFFDNVDHEWMVRMLERRIDDRALIGLIRKWLKAGVLKPDGGVEYPERGTPQGSIISPILANIYLHFVLDLWFENVVKQSMSGKAVLVRYADDFVVGFKYHKDAALFYRALPARLKKFGLEAAKKKTRKLMFNRFRKEDSKTFDFLGFEFRWTVSRKGKDIIRLRTCRKKVRRLILDLKQWIKDHMSKRLKWIMGMVKTKLRGLYNYFGVIGNSASLREIYILYCRTLYRWLNRRSQRKSFNLKTFSFILRYHGIVRYRSRLLNEGIQLSLLPYLC
jgi:RNA-directed DNA polymerase